eukprot:TRINITY_DN5661_c0_g2_i1.p2 TRINITY_DN5661_c0_g2~~TRINITY_DN5661_c0_g2_i1.p2  ORF type:complete len:100 (-),score=7.90 TRINITY_DN5661_c0_g2_i1:160-459(-)
MQSPLNCSTNERDTSKPVIQVADSKTEPPDTEGKQRACHCCCAATATRIAVKCQSPECGLFFCRTCLVRYHKFSRRIAKRLPSPAWKCPRCLQKCRCQK